MSVDFTTILAQIVNFTILAWALYKFLYKPLLVAIGKREKHIADEVQNAENLAAEAEKKLDDLNKRYLDIDNERSHILSEAREEADKLRKQLEQEVHAEILEKRLIWQQELDREKALLTNEFRQAVVSNFLEFARKAFKSMADETLEERFVSVFKRKLEELPRKDKKLLAADTEDASVQISTSEEITSEAQDALKKMLADVLELEDPEVVFIVNPHLLCGIEFSVNGNVVSWNLDDYLNTFTTKMHDALENISLRISREEG
ncbi:MAG: F0F1 ATP synthase subunit delta [Alphaproteobacteria bacterium]|nr:F0F1 ATP synthase subunit delta [Alphaproteobacteria bacterium]